MTRTEELKLAKSKLRKTRKQYRELLAYLDEVKMEIKFWKLKYQRSQCIQYCYDIKTRQHVFRMGDMYYVCEEPQKPQLQH